MQFVYPHFLYALGFIAIPIIIHLFNLVKPKEVVFSSIQFLKEVDLKSSRKVRLKHILILLSRIFFITALVFLFAQPIIPSDNNTGEPISNHVSIYLDNSLSMGIIANDEQKNAYAIKELNTIIDKYPRGTKFQLIDNDFKPNSLFYFKKDKVKDMLTEVSLTSKVKSAREIYLRQQALKKNNNIEKLDVIWFSDFQKEVFDDIGTIEKDSTLTHYLFNINGNTESNVYIDSVYLLNPFIKKGENTELTVVLKNASTNLVNNLNVKIIVGENELANNSVSINGNAKEEVKINFVLDKVGESKIKIEITNDDVEFDNSFYLTLNVENQLNILTISDSTTSVISKVFENESMFNSTVTNSGSIDYGTLNKYDLIVFDHLLSINPSLVNAIEKQLNKSSIVVIPNRKIDNESYSNLFNKLNCAVVVKKENVKETLSAPEFNNPFFKGIFEKEDTKINMPEITSVFKLMNVSNTILKSQSGNISLAKYDYKGNAYVFSSSLKAPESNFLRHSLIVPLMYKMAMNSSNKNRNLYSYINGSFDNIPDNDSIKGVYSLRNEKIEFIPDQKIVNGNLQINFNGDDVISGFYKLMKGNQFIQTLSINIDKKESVLESLDTEKIDVLNDLGNVETNSSLAEQFEKMSVGESLWKYCLYLALLFLLIEILLIRFYKK